MARRGVSSRQIAVKIRPAKKADAKEILAIFHDTVSEERYLATSVWDLPRTLREQQEDIFLQNEQKNGGYFVATVARQVVGVVSLLGGILLRQEHVAQLEIFIHRDSRRHGIGRSLMLHAIQWAHNNSYLRKISLSVFADNYAAVALYTELGFVIEGRCEGDFRERDGKLRDRLLMAYWLNS